MITEEDVYCLLELGMSVEEAAQELGVSVSVVESILSYKNTSPN